MSSTELKFSHSGEFYTFLIEDSLLISITSRATQNLLCEMFDLNSEFFACSFTMRFDGGLHQIQMNFFRPPNTEWIEIKHQSLSHHLRTTELDPNLQRFLPVAPVCWQNSPYSQRYYTDRKIKKLRQLLRRLRGINSKAAKNGDLGREVIARHADENKRNFSLGFKSKRTRGVFTYYPFSYCKEFTQHLLPFNL